MSLPRVARLTPSAAAAAVVVGSSRLRSRVARSASSSDNSVRVDRPGKPSLVLDLVEEFRAYAVDRCVFALLNQRVNERLEADEQHEGRRRRLRTIIQSQARRVATYVRGDAADYHPWAGRW